MCLYIDDAGDYTHLESGYRTARKEHTCGECGRFIESGERYWFDKSVDHYDSTIATQKMCGHCDAVLNVGVALTGCHKAWWFGEVFNWTDETMGFVANIIRDHDLVPGATVRMLRYVALAKRHWRDRAGELVPITEIAS